MATHSPTVRTPDWCRTCTFRGTLERILFSALHDDGDSGTAIVLLRDDSRHSHRVIAEDCDLQTLAVGQRFHATGVLEDDPLFGLQLRGILSFDLSGLDLTGLRIFLADHLPGVGPVIARRLVDAYGFEVVRILRDTRQAIEDGILRPEVAEAARQLFQRQGADLIEAAAELYQLLAQTRVPRWPRLVRRLIRRYRATAAVELRERPLEVCLAGVIPFPVADTLHLRFGGDPHCIDRHLAALREAMARDRSSTWNRSCMLPTQMHGGRGDEPLDWKAAAKAGIDRSIFCRDELPGDKLTPLLALATRARDESGIATAIRRLQARPFRWPDPSRLAIASHQREQLAVALAGSVGVLDGAPGTGKSYAASRLIEEAVRCGLPVFVACPTGKAAQRQRELLQKRVPSLQPMTIHRLLGAVAANDESDDEECVFRFAHSSTNPLEIALYVIDEASMIGASLAARLFEAIPMGSGVLLLGDTQQLPSVEHGMVLRDLIAAGIPCGHLTEPHRHSQGVLLTALEAIRAGSALPTIPQLLRAEDDLVFLQASSAESVRVHLTSALDLFEERGFPQGSIQVIAPTNKLCASINALLQERWNHSDDSAVTSCRPREGDRVLNRKNRFLALASRSGQVASPTRTFVANGEQGTIEAIGSDRAAIIRLATEERVASRIPAKGTAKRNADGSIQGVPDRFNDWSLAYCMTCHRAQGSEWPVVLVLLEDHDFVDRSWIYTALSRGRQHVVVIGAPRQLRDGLTRLVSSRRITRLQAKLEQP